MYHSGVYRVVRFVYGLAAGIFYKGFITFGIGPLFRAAARFNNPIVGGYGFFVLSGHIVCPAEDEKRIERFFLFCCDRLHNRDGIFRPVEFKHVEHGQRVDRPRVVRIKLNSPFIC